MVFVFDDHAFRLAFYRQAAGQAGKQDFHFVFHGCGHRGLQQGRHEFRRMLQVGIRQYNK